jgi:hypothetical protein
MKQKVKLVFARSYVENPTSNDCFAETIHIELPSHIKQAHLISARSYQPEEMKDSHTLGGDDTATIWDYHDEQHLVGKLLTYIDATYSDKEQRQAHKDILKDVVYGYFQELRTRAIQTVKAYPDK